MFKVLFVASLLICLVIPAAPSSAADLPGTTQAQVVQTSAVDQPIQLTDAEMLATKGEDGTVWIRCVGYKQAWKNAAYAYAGTVLIKRIAGSGWANATGLHWGGNNEIHYWRWITPNQTMKNLGLGKPGLIIDRSTMRW